MSQYPDYFDENSEFNTLYNSEYSDEDVSSDCDSTSTDDDYEPVWIENVSSKGDLFYLEPSVHVNDTFATPGDGNTSHPCSRDSSNQVSKSKTSEKFKEWMKHRRKQIKKRFNSRDQEATVVGSNSAGRMACKAPMTEVKEIFLDIDTSCHNYGRRATLAEKLFGIIVSPVDGPNNDNRLVVTGLTPHGEACKEGTIKIGDWLTSVNDVDVTFSNLNTVLGNILPPKQVKLVIQRCVAQNILQTPLNVQSSNNSLLEHLIGSFDPIEYSKCAHLPHAMYYLTTSSESTAEENDDVVYHYPDTEGPLFKLKGMYVTLARMMVDVATPPALSCTISLQGELIHISFIMEGNHLMVLALPQCCVTVAEIQHFSVDIAKLLRLQFSTLSHAFGDVENKEYVDHFFKLFFHHFLFAASKEKSCSESHLLHILPSVHWFPLPSHAKIVVDDILCQLESADFSDMSEGYYGIRRIYNILGSCMFYKGYLLGSHLEKDDLLDIHLFMQYHCLLSLTKVQPVFRAIVWKEVYPSRRQHNKNLQNDPDFIETEGRYFMLIVAIKHSILATILEAGGCALSVSGFPSPEPFYVDQMENTLLQFELSGIFSTIEKLIGMQDPQLASPDTFLRAEERCSWEILSSIVGLTLSSSGRLHAKRSQSYSNLFAEDNKKFSEVISITKKGCDEDFERQQLLSNMGPADGESDAEDNIACDAFSQHKRLRRLSASTSSNTGSHGSEENLAFQGSVMKSHFNSSYDVRTALSTQEHLDSNAVQGNIQKFAAGSQSTMFYYLHIDPAEGIFLAPTAQLQKLLQSSLGHDFLQIFYRCCLQMRTTFERCLKNKELFLNAVVPNCGLNTFLKAAYEQGALLQLSTDDSGSSQKKKSMNLTFWVVGRLFFSPYPREVYVCYHDSIQQNVVELAFRLGFGLSL